MVVEHPEAERSCRCPAEEMRGPSPTQGLPSSLVLGIRVPTKSDYKSVRILALPVKQKKPENPDVPFKGPTHRLVHL